MGIFVFCMLDFMFPITVLLIADWKNQRVQVKQLGANTSAVDGNDIGHNTEVVMTPDSTLFILSGNRVFFS